MVLNFQHFAIAPSNDSNEMPNLSESPAKSKSQSLLSFLNKSKLTSNEDVERPSPGPSTDQPG